MTSRNSNEGGSAFCELLMQSDVFPDRAMPLSAVFACLSQRITALGWDGFLIRAPQTLPTFKTQPQLATDPVVMSRIVGQHTLVTDLPDRLAGQASRIESPVWQDLERRCAEAALCDIVYGDIRWSETHLVEAFRQEDLHSLLCLREGSSGLTEMHGAVVFSHETGAPFERLMARTGLQVCFTLATLMKKLKHAGTDNSSVYLHLTQRQRDIVRRLMAGQTNKNIASELGVTPAAISRHMSKLKQAFDVETTPELLVKIGVFLKS